MERNEILIVDDSELNRRIISDTLKSEYKIHEAQNGVEAIDYIFKNYEKLVMIILDIMMPQLNGVETMKIIKSDPRTEPIPVIMITAADSNEEYCFRLGATDFIKKPFNKNVVLSRVNAHIYSKFRFRNNVDSERNSVSESLFTKILYAMAAYPDACCENPSYDTERCNRITRLFAAEVCQKMGMEYADISRHLRMVADFMPLRDIGKFKVDREVLRKTSPLTDEEFAQIKKHCEYGVYLLERFTKAKERELISFFFEIVSDHHENYDGTGYPEGKKENEISHAGKIAAIVDCYIGMTADRTYRKAFSHEKTLEYIESQKNKKFDGKLVDIFLKLPFNKMNIFVKEERR